LREFGDDFDELWTWIGKEFIEGSKGWGDVWDKVINKMTEGMKRKWNEMRTENKRKFEEMKEDMKRAIIGGVEDIIRKYYEMKENIRVTLNGIKENHEVIWGIIKGIIKQKASEAWSDFKAEFAPLTSWFDNNIKKPVRRVRCRIR
jgi:hypothetical protein